MEEQNKVNIEVVSVDDLIQDDHNFNKGTEQGQQLIERSFRECGAGRSVFIDKDNRLVGGNKAQKGFKAAGKKRVVIVDSDPDTLVAVRRKDVSLDSAEGRRMALLDNLTTQVNLAWDPSEIEAVSSEIDGFDPSDYGFDPSQLEVAGMGDETKPATQTEVKEDDFDPDAHYETKVKRGEVWQLGEHRLMCGDSTSADDVAKLMNGEQADGVLTDPPFGNDLGYGRGQLGERYIANDSDTKVLSSFFAPLDSVLKNNTHCLVWIQWRTFSTLEKAFEKYKLRTVVIWDKMQPGLSGGGFAEQYEMMCVFIKGHATQNEYCGNVWQISREHDKRSESEHPHKKPIALLGKALNLCSKEGDIILDLFGGSGSTLIACEQLNRKCRMMELDPHYCTVIIARWEKLTGQKAVKLNP